MNTHNRFLIRSLLSLAMLVALLGLVNPLQAATGDIGYRDFYYGTTVNSTPTGEKPESKLWWNDGSWWGYLWSPALASYTIYRLDWSTQTWIDTGTKVDTRSSTKADALWDGQHLYIASHVYTSDGKQTSSSSWGRLFRFSYDPQTKTYHLDPGFPVAVTNGKSETLVIDKDSTGQLWVTYVESNRVMVNRSLGSDLTWGTPFILPTKTNSTTVDSDDISSVVAFQGNKIGVMWSNQVLDKMFFAVHLDGDSDGTWQAEQTALPGPKDCTSGLCADDHINLKSIQADSSGRVFAAVKTSLTASNAPLVLLLVRDLNGNWTSNVFGRVSDGHTRPIVLLDEEHGRIYMFATAPEAGGAIYYKSSDINNISFPLGVGQLFIDTSKDLKINNATSTKQNVNSTTGLVVLASDDGTHYYLHNSLVLGTPPATSTPTSTFTPTATSTATSTATPTMTSTATATSDPNSTPTNTPTPTDTLTPTATATETLTPTATPTTTSGLPIKNITFEGGSLVDASSGVDKVVGVVTLDSASLLKGVYSADFPNTASYLEQGFAPVDDIYISFYLKLNSLPAGDVRLALISNAGISVGNLLLRPSGVLRLRNASTTIGADSPPLALGTVYRAGLHQKRGGGGDAILEAYLAVGDQPFGAPFTALSSGTWTTQADRLRLGASTTTPLDAYVDNILLDGARMPDPSS